MQKIVYRWIVVTGTLIILTGGVHNACMNWVCSMQTCTGDYKWFFLTMGATLIYTGLVILFSVILLKRFDPWGWKVALASGIFVGLLGICGIYLKEYGASILVILSILELIPVILYRQTIMHNPQTV